MALVRRGLAIRFGVVLLVFSAVSSAWAVKWTSCPGPPRRERLVRGGLAGYVTSFFVHPGHDFVVRLKDHDVPKHSAGFSTEPDGNTIEITFTPFDGDPIPLPPFTATAVSPSTLRFTFPDPQAIVGRVLAGPVKIVVRNGGAIAADMSRYPVVLPPFNDVAALVEQGADADVRGTMDLRGDLYIPLQFGGFGEHTPPSCPAVMTPLVTLAVDFSIRDKDGGAIPHIDFTELKKGRLYLGDFVLGDTDFYGTVVAKSLDVKRVHGRGITLCGINDTLQLVMWLPLENASTRPKSLIIPLVRDGSPFVMKARDVTTDPEFVDDLRKLKKDSFGTPCVLP